jgi:4-diphosphocytidyl-2-C-methyl-D-erythritol kinase
VKITECAPAKVNLVLRVGGPRADGLHPLCSIFASVDLEDSVSVCEAEEDAVECGGVEGPNLAATAIDAFRAEVPSLPPLEVRIEKRIPVAAGLGGGSADAAAVLRAANQLSGARLPPGRLRALAARIGSDVPSQIEPRHSLVRGVGEELEPLSLPRMTLLLLPRDQGLSTPAVFGELDRLRDGLDPPAAWLDPEPLRRLATAGLHGLAAGIENDLARAALSLRPELAQSLERLLDAGALAAGVTGSGPTTFGVFEQVDDATSAARRIERSIVASPRAC